jgi:hypothetical protein
MVTPVVVKRNLDMDLMHYRDVQVESFVCAYM